MNTEKNLNSCVVSTHYALIKVLQLMFSFLVSLKLYVKLLGVFSVRHLITTTKKAPNIWLV